MDLVVGHELYTRLPNATEGQLTALRSQLVSSAALAAISIRLGLHEQVRLGRGEEETGGRARTGLSASVYESLVGAVYLDGGLDAARALIQRTMGDILDGAERVPRRSSKTLLQEWAQGEHRPLPAYDVVEVSGPEHRRGFVVRVEVGELAATGTGASKREAQEAAAARLLEEVPL